jgi:hypothetical protein
VVWTGLEYDLDLFNIVAVDDFNMGAMENKSLNIFNSRLVLASPRTATDLDFKRIEGVVAHEYFHNWCVSSFLELWRVPSLVSSHSTPDQTRQHKPRSVTLLHRCVAADAIQVTDTSKNWGSSAESDREICCLPPHLLWIPPSHRIPVPPSSNRLAIMLLLSMSSCS